MMILCLILELEQIFEIPVEQVFFSKLSVTGMRVSYWYYSNFKLHMCNIIFDKIFNLDKLLFLNKNYFLV